MIPIILLRQYESFSKLNKGKMNGQARHLIEKLKGTRLNSISREDAPEKHLVMSVNCRLKAVIVCN